MSKYSSFVLLVSLLFVYFSMIRGFTFGSRLRFGRSLLSTTLMSTISRAEAAAPTKSMPITVLSGFLGAGKTTFLNHLLNNKEGKRFGLVVNDMASVNVDAKQIKQTNFAASDGIDTMELQNGCVCCSLAEDLIASVAKLNDLAELRGLQYDHIILECSGIAEPRKIRDLFQEAVTNYDLALMKKVKLDTLITVVDATAFVNLFGSDKVIGDKIELAYPPKNPESAVAAAVTDGEAPPEDPNMEENTKRKITELLLEQVECADIVLINKCDLLQKPSDVDLVRQVISSINPSARILSCVKGNVPNPLTLTGSAQGKGAAAWGIIEEHRNMVQAVDKQAQLGAHCHLDHVHTEECSHGHNLSHSHGHGHSHEHEHHHSHDCEGTTCTHPSHSHSHSHEAVECHDTHCTDPTHKHDHSHHHDHHHHEEGSACTNTACTDPTHHHDHGHHHHQNADATTAEKRFGITSFTYKRRVPFHPKRFTRFLHSLGKLSVSGMADLDTVPSASYASSAAAPSGGGAKWDSDLAEATKALLRSKGFVWMATSSAAGYFMSHAGQFLELLVLGRWWADIPESQWPAEMRQEILQDFDTSTSGGGRHGDRRQELVFIGQFGAKGMEKSRRALEAMLDSCLLTPEEMKEYERIAVSGQEGSDHDNLLKEHFIGYPPEEATPAASEEAEDEMPDLIPNEPYDDEEEEVKK